MDDKKRNPGAARARTGKRPARKKTAPHVDDAAMYRAVIDMFPGALMLNDMDGIIRIATRQAAELHGYDSAEEMIGLNVFDTIAPEENSKTDATFNRLLETGSIIVEHILIKKDGTRFPAELRLALLRDKGGKPAGIVSTSSDITQRKHSEAVLRESETRYRRITGAVTDYIYSVRIEEGRPVETIHGPACEAVTGYTSEELNRDPYLWIKMVHEEDRDAVRNMAGRLLTGAGAEAIEHRIWRKDGSLRWVRNTPVPHFNAGGRLTSYDGLISDITVRKLAESALQEREERYRIITELSTDYVFKVSIREDGSLSIDYISENLLKMTGRTHTDVKTSDLWGGIIHPDDVRAFMDFQANVITNGMDGELECRSFHKDGTMRWIRIFCRPIFDESGRRIVSVIGAIKDIDERKKAEEAMLDIKKQLEFILGVTRTGIDIIDADFNVVYIDPEWMKLYGEPAGRKCYDYFMGRSEVCPGCGIPQALETKKVTVTEEVLIKENNRVIEVHTIPFQRLNGEWQVAEFNVDITERKKSEEKIKASLREKETLLKEIHHRVKNNLQIITSLLNLQTRAVSDGELLKQFTDAQNRIRSMALVHEKLYQSEDLGRIDIRSYIRELSDEIMISYASILKDIKLTVEADESHLPIDQAIPFGLIINELLTNAIKYAFPEGWGGKKEMLIRYRQAPDGTAELVIRDSGKGMPAGVEIGRTETLGLMLVPMLAQQLNGTITIERTGGTTITIQFRNK